MPQKDTRLWDQVVGRIAISSLRRLRSERGTGTVLPVRKLTCTIVHDADKNQVLPRDVLVYVRFRCDWMERFRVAHCNRHDLAADLHLQCPWLSYSRSDGHGYGPSRRPISPRFPRPLSLCHGHVGIILFYLHSWGCVHYLVWCANGIVLNQIPLVES
jgi:hypothetical protein